MPDYSANGTAAGAVNTLRRPRSDSVPDAPPTQRGPWAYAEAYGCVLHDRVRCEPCAAFIRHLEPAADTQVYRLAREDQDRDGFRAGYRVGFAHAEQETSALEEQLRLANARIADFMSGLARPSVPLTREVAHGRGGPGRLSGGGGGRGRPYTPFNSQDRGPTTRRTATAWEAIAQDFDGPRPRRQARSTTTIQPTPPVQPTVTEANTTRSDAPMTTSVVDSLLDDLNNEGPSSTGFATLRQARHWIFTANLAARNQTITDAQRYLLREWRVPEWARRGPTSAMTPSPTPSLGDSLAHWINYYDNHPRAPCPIGVHRDPNGHVNVDLLRGHLLTVNIIGSGPRRNHLRREGQLALAGLLIDAEVYAQQCTIHGVQPQGPLAAVPLPPLDVDQAAEDVGPLDRVDFSVRTLGCNSWAS